MCFYRPLVVCSLLSSLALACAGTAPIARGPSPENDASVRAASGKHVAGASAPPAPLERADARAPAATERGVAEADAIVRDSLAVPGRDDRFSVDRQVSELERAIGLYRQFLERAGDDPHFADAVKRSRDRIADAEQTIAFLRQQVHAP